MRALAVAAAMAIAPLRAGAEEPAALHFQAGNYDFGRGLGAFVRASFNDGQNETWAFTEIDRSLAVGAVQSGARWGRERDEAGARLSGSGLSGPHPAHPGRRGLGVVTLRRAPAPWPPSPCRAR